jgi:probable addiction module antidote protein
MDPATGFIFDIPAKRSLFSFVVVTRAHRNKTSGLQKGFGRNWSEEMVEQLHDYDPADALKSDEAVEIFLADAFETGDSYYIAKAIGVIARAKGMAKIARETGLAREQLYKSLSETGNPTLETTLAVLKAVGFELTSRRSAA